MARKALVSRRARIRTQGVLAFQIQKDLKTILSKYPIHNLKWEMDQVARCCENHLYALRPCQKIKPFEFL